MPVYEYRCRGCGQQVELLQERGAGPPAGGCAACGDALQRCWSRVAVRYGSWGFTATDRLVADTRGKDFRALRDKAEQISDEAR